MQEKELTNQGLVTEVSLRDKKQFHTNPRCLDKEVEYSIVSFSEVEDRWNKGRERGSLFLDLYWRFLLDIQLDILVNLSFIFLNTKQAFDWIFFVEIMLHIWS